MTLIHIFLVVRTCIFLNGQNRIPIHKIRLSDTGKNMTRYFLGPCFSDISLWKWPWSKSLEPVDQVGGLVLGREIVQLDHVTKLVNVDGGVGGLEGKVIHLKITYVYQVMTKSKKPYLWTYGIRNNFLVRYLNFRIDPFHIGKYRLFSSSERNWPELNNEH